METKLNVTCIKLLHDKACVFDNKMPTDNP